MMARRSYVVTWTAAERTELHWFVQIGHVHTFRRRRDVDTAELLQLHALPQGARHAFAKQGLAASLVPPRWIIPAGSGN